MDKEEENKIMEKLEEMEEKIERINKFETVDIDKYKSNDVNYGLY